MTLYAMRPDPDSGDVVDGADIVDQSKYGWQFLEQALSLLQLVDQRRAEQLEAIMVRLNEGDDQLRIGPSDLRLLVGLLEGVEVEIETAGFVNDKWRVDPARLQELKARVPSMDLETERDLKSKTSALGEVMINAIAIRNFLRDALDQGCVVILG